MTTLGAAIQTHMYSGVVIKGYFYTSLHNIDLKLPNKEVVEGAIPKAQWQVRRIQA